MKFLFYSLRFFKKFIIYSLLNIIGITIAVVFAICGVLFFKVQLSYDNFHAPNVYRVQLGHEQNAAMLFPALAEQLKTDFPEIKEVTRLKRTSATLQYKQKRISDSKAYYVDETFFDVLSYQILHGDGRALSEPNTIFLTENVANMLSPSPASLVGEIILFPQSEGYKSFLVGGIMADIPANSHLQFDMLISYNSIEEGKSSFQYGWAFKGVITYFKSTQPINLDREQSKNYLLGIKQQEKNNSIQDDEALAFIPIDKVHYLSNLLPDEKYGNLIQSYALLVLFVVLLITLVFNFYGSSIIVSHFRAKDLKLRKIFGASSWRLFLEKLVENGITFSFSFGLALTILYVNSDFFSQTFGISNKIISNEIRILGFSMFGVIGLFAIAPSIQSYIYARSIDVKGKLVVTRNVKNPLGKIVLLQVAISLILSILSLGVFTQLSYIEEKNSLIDTKNIIVIDPSQESSDSNYQLAFMNEIQKIDFVKNAAMSNTVPFDNFPQLWWGVTYQQINNFENEYAIVDADSNYFKVYDIDILDGTFGIHPNDILINKNFYDLFLSPVISSEDLINEQIILRSDTFRITGVVENYYHLSSKNLILPTIYRNQHPTNSYFSVKINSDISSDKLSEIQEVWSSIYPNELFVQHFLEDGYEKLISEDKQLLSIAGLLTASVAILSIFALIVTISINFFQRQKEFAIREIIGASRVSNIWLILKEYLIGIALASIISIPLANVLLKYWLMNYVDQASLPITLFLLPCLTFFTITLIIILLIFNGRDDKFSVVERLDS